MSLLRVVYHQLTSRFPPFQTLLNELGLLFGIMAAAGRFVVLSDDEITVFSEKMRTRKPKTAKTDVKGF
jgi:hypothetical protein